VFATDGVDHDLNGTSHSLDVTAETLYEAVAQALATVRGHESGTCYCTTTVRVVLWLRLPDLALTLTTYVSLGVPGLMGAEDELPPQPGNVTNADITTAAAQTRRRRPCIDRNPKTNKATVDAQ